jgi:hypothetical protein
MISSTYARVLLTGLGLLALATTASAECAWVLWTETTFTSKADRPPSTYWTAEQGFSDSSGCWDILKTILDQRRKGGDRYTVWETNVMDNRSLDIRRYACLPDTVDPRGPKGK